jgi:hypothetical protein
MWGSRSANKLNESCLYGFWLRDGLEFVESLEFLEREYIPSILQIRKSKSTGVKMICSILQAIETRSSNFLFNNFYIENK